MSVVHSFDVAEATKYGKDEAILIQNFRFWIEHNMQAGTSFREGRTWSYMSQEALVDRYPYFSRDQIQRILKSLVDQGVLLAVQWLGWKRTKSYAFVNEPEFINAVFLEKRLERVEARKYDVTDSKKANDSALRENPQSQKPQSLPIEGNGAKQPLETARCIAGKPSDALRETARSPNKILNPVPESIPKSYERTAIQSSIEYTDRPSFNNDDDEAAYETMEFIFGKTKTTHYKISAAYSIQDKYGGLIAKDAWQQLTALGINNVTLRHLLAFLEDTTKKPPSENPVAEGI